MAMRGGAPSPPSPPGAVQGPYPLWGTPPWILQDVAVYHHMAKHMIVEKITFEITDKCYKEAARQLEQEPPGCEQVCQEMAHRGAIEPPPPRHLKCTYPPLPLPLPLNNRRGHIFFPILPLVLT